MVITGTGTDDFSNEVFDTIFYNNTLTIGNWCKPTNLIMDGNVDIGGSNRVPSVTDLTIATGGALSPVARTLTCAGDFTTSGGLIGKSALTFDETAQSNKVAIPDDSTLDLTTAGTLMAWVKLPTDAGLKAKNNYKIFRRTK